MRRLKKLFLLLACFVLPCFFLLSACGKSVATETGFSVFYGDKKLSVSGETIHLVYDAELDIDSLFVVEVSFDDQTTSTLTKKTAESSGYEITTTIPSLSEIVIGNEYEIVISYKEYSSYKIKVVFENATLSAPVLSFDDVSEKLSWNLVSKATAYEYKVMKNDEVEFGETQTTNENYIMLQWGSKYKVRAIADGEQQEASDWVETERWKPERTLLTRPSISNLCTDFKFELNADGEPKVHYLELDNFKNETMAVTNENLITEGAVGGSYDITFSIKNPNKYAWADGLTASFTKTWSIGRKSVTIPTLEDKIFSGSEISYSIADSTENNYYEIDQENSVISATNVGTYNVVFRLKYPMYCSWSNGLTNIFGDNMEYVTCPWEIKAGESSSNYYPLDRDILLSDINQSDLNFIKKDEE